MTGLFLIRRFTSICLVDAWIATRSVACCLLLFVYSDAVPRLARGGRSRRAPALQVAPHFLAQ